MEDNKKYTLEYHLKCLASQDQDYEVLYSIWDLNKRNLTNGLNLISMSFPHYSVHDISHSMTIIDNIQCFLGEDRIKRLSASDTFLILMAGLTHDIGMILMYNIVETEWEKENFKAVLEKFAGNADPVIARAASLLIRIHHKETEQDLKNFKWALEVKNAVIIITAEIFRSKHAKQSADYLLTNGIFKQLANNFHAEQLPKRFVDLLSNIAFLHGESFGEVMTRLYYEANGYRGDYIHPRFIAYMIRLGDLLDFDNNRFNAYSMVMLKDIPEQSKAHEQKHLSVKHMLISPNAIEAELDCPNEEVYRISRSWFDWLEEEVSNQSREWTSIAPGDLGGLPPIISKGNIKILYNGIQCNPDLLNLRFTMSQEKIFSILKGGGIYKEPGFVFIREIVQNAFDASKMQLWNDIQSGSYDLDVDSIKFPNDIDAFIYKRYPVELQVKWKDEQKKVLRFECIDYGTGISEDSLLRMTNFVGDSHNNDLNYQTTYRDMPYFLRPTAVFGIGMQSIFFVAPTFEVETYYVGETSKRIIFRSAADGQYSSIVKENIGRKRGTTIKVDIPKEKFAELFGSSFSFDILETTDVFKGDGDSLYLAKIDKFVRDTFSSVESSYFKYSTPNMDRGFENYKVNGEKDKYYDDKDDYRYSFNYQDNILVFTIYERMYGSKFEFWFNDRLKTYELSQRLLLRDVLVSNAKFNFYKTAYLGFEWNLCSQSTDKVVDLSRDNLTYRGRKWITKTLLSDLLPEFLKLIEPVFINELANNKNNNLLSQYFNYVLSRLACNLDVDQCIGELSNYELRDVMASYNGSVITADRLLTADSLLWVSGFKTKGENIIQEQTKNEIMEKCSEKLDDHVVLWEDSYFYESLMPTYICSEVIKYDKECQIYKLEKRKNTEKTSNAKTSIDAVDEYVLALEANQSFGCSRSTIYGWQKYPNIIVKRNFISGFEQFPRYSQTCIYSPFSNRKESKDLVDKLKGKSEEDAKKDIRQNINTYLTPFMMQIIKEYNINEKVTDEQIVDDYVSLIYDFVSQKKKVM